MARIARLRAGISNIHLVEAEDGYVLVDAGSRHRPEKRLQGAMAKLGVAPEQVRLLVITHVHYDHVMGVKAIRDLCSCPVAVHRAEAEDLARGRMVFPPGRTAWARAAAWLGRTLEPAMTAFAPHEAEFVVGDQMDLNQFGLAGRLVSTPGHSPGSMSLILEDGQALVGDTVFNPYPFNLGPVMPPFYHDRERLLQTWEHLISLGLKKFFPGHGPALDSEKLTKAYLRHAHIDTRPQ